MRTTLIAVAVACLVGAVAGVAAAQSRTDTYDAADAKTVAVQVVPLSDGGCFVGQVCMQLDSNNGGQDLGSCIQLDETSGRLNTTNVNRCQALLDVGARRYLKALRFPVDAGG